jgi:hypothetical protein
MLMQKQIDVDAKQSGCNASECKAKLMQSKVDAKQR